MPQPAVERVKRPLHRQGLVRPGLGKDRQCRTPGLEVEKVDGLAQPGQFILELRIEARLPRLDDVADRALGRSEPRVVERHLADGAVPVGEQRAQHVARDARDLGDRELGQVVVAVPVERAGVRVVAAPAYDDLGDRPGEHLPELAEQPRHGLDERLHLGSDILKGEELPQIVGAPRIHVVAVEMKQPHAADRNAGAAQYVGLDAQVGDVLGLDLRGRLDLDERPAVIVLLEQRVGAHQYSVVAESGFVEAAGTVADEALGGLHAPGRSACSPPRRALRPGTAGAPARPPRGPDRRWPAWPRSPGRQAGEPGTTATDTWGTAAPPGTGILRVWESK